MDQQLCWSSQHEILPSVCDLHLYFISLPKPYDGTLLLQLTISEKHTSSHVELGKYFVLYQFNRLLTLLLFQWYPYVFIGSILAFVEGLLFAYFTFDLMSEQITSIDDNQSYIDDLKKQYGKQNDFFDNAKLSLGDDFLWWLTPTHPELRTNFFERVWPKKEVRQMYRTDVFDMPEENSDPDKKLFIIE